jgi:hypothetical protein
MKRASINDSQDDEFASEFHTSYNKQNTFV